MPYLEHDHLERILKTLSTDKIWEICGKKITEVLSGAVLCHKLSEAIESEYDENHEIIKEVREIIAIHQNEDSKKRSDSQDEGTQKGEGDYPQPRKAIERESHQAGLATPSVNLKAENQNGGSGVISQLKEPHDSSNIQPPAFVEKKVELPFDPDRDPIYPQSDYKSFMNQWPPSPELNTKPH